MATQGQPQAACTHPACKCKEGDVEGFCSEFCKSVEGSEDTQRCGCGHMCCDSVGELGNEGTFDKTGS